MKVLLTSLLLSAALLFQGPSVAQQDAGADLRPPQGRAGMYEMRDISAEFRDGRRMGETVRGSRTVCLAGSQGRYDTRLLEQVAMPGCRFAASDAPQPTAAAGLAPAALLRDDPRHLRAVESLTGQMVCESGDAGVFVLHSAPGRTVLSLTTQGEDGTVAKRTIAALYVGSECDAPR